MVVNCSPTIEGEPGPNWPYPSTEEGQDNDNDTTGELGADEV
jgi:hypothetical protein